MKLYAHIHIHLPSPIPPPQGSGLGLGISSRFPGLKHYRNPGLLGGVLSVIGLLLCLCFTGDDPEHVKPDHT